MKKPSMTVGTKAHRTAVTMKKESMAKLKKSMAKKEESKFKSSEEAYKFNADALKNTLSPDFKGSPKATENTKKIMKRYNLTEIPDQVDFKKLEADYQKRKKNVRVKTLPEVEVTATKMKKPVTKMKKEEAMKMKKPATKMVMPKDKPLKKDDTKQPKRPPKPKKPVAKMVTPKEMKKKVDEKFPRKLTKFDKLKMMVKKSKVTKKEGAKPVTKMKKNK